MVNVEIGQSPHETGIETTIPLYRLYNSAADDHLYTTDAIERQTFLAQGNYRDEGIAAWVCSAPQPGTRPLYRLYDGNDHFYTTSLEEQEHATAFGYRSQGQVGFVFSSPGNATLPLYRLWHPQTGDHFYTFRN